MDLTTSMTKCWNYFVMGNLAEIPMKTMTIADQSCELNVNTK